MYTLKGKEKNVFVVGSEIEQLALPHVKIKDVVIRTDEGSHYTALNSDNLLISDWEILPATGGTNWGDSRTESAGGIGLLHTISSAAAAGTQALKIVTPDSGISYELNIVEINMGTQARGHKALKIIGGGSSTAKRGIIMSFTNSFSGRAIDINIQGTGDGVRVQSNNNANPSMTGFYYVGTTSLHKGFAFKSTCQNNSPSEHIPIDLSVISTLASTPRTLSAFKFNIERTIAGPGGTVIDDFEAMEVIRTNKPTTGNLTARGSVATFKNIESPYGGVLTDSVDVVKILQSLDSTGYPVKITQNAVISTKFKKYISLDDHTFWSSIDGTVANGNLAGIKGDICLNGGSGGVGKPAQCTADGTTWADLSSASWGDVRTQPGGTSVVGLTHIISATALTGTQALKIVCPTGPPSLDLVEIDMGTAGVAHSALKIVGGSSATLKKAIELSLSNYAGIGVQVTLSGYLGSGIGMKMDLSGDSDGIIIYNNSTASNVGFQYYGQNNSQAGTAFGCSVSKTNAANFNPMSLAVNALSSNVDRTTDGFLLSITHGIGSSGVVLSDDYEVMKVIRTSNISWSGTSALSAEGTVGYFENSITGAWASGVTDNVSVMKLIQDDLSLGMPLNIIQNAIVSVSFKKYISLDALTIWSSMDGTVANGNLTGVKGDICLNGGSGGTGKTAQCTADGNTWADM